MHPNDKTSGLKKTFKKKCISPLHKSYHKSTFEPFGQGILSAVMTCRISCRVSFHSVQSFLAWESGTIVLVPSFRYGTNKTYAKKHLDKVQLPKFTIRLILPNGECRCTLLQSYKTDDEGRGWHGPWHECMCTGATGWNGTGTDRTS